MLPPSLPPDENERIASLRALNILDTPSEERFDHITRLAALAFDVPIALVSLVDVNRQWFKSCIGLDSSETDREVSFCGHAILRDSALVIPDACQDPRFADNPLVTGPPNIRFYAGQPLDDGRGYKLGTLCVIDHRPRNFGDDQIRLLEELGSLAERELNSIGLERALALERSGRQRLEAITEALSEGLVTMSTDGTITSFNRAAESLFGYRQSELVGSDARILLAGDARGDVLSDRAHPIAPFDHRVITLARRDGSPFSAELAVSEAATDDGAFLIATVRDVSDRSAMLRALRTSEELHRSVVESLHEGIVVHAADGTISACNKRAEEILGLPVEQITGAVPTDPSWRCVRPDGSPMPGGEHPASVALTTGEPCPDVLMGVHRPSGDLRWISVTAQPMVTSDGEPDGVAVSFADMTDRVTIEKMKDEFVSIVSHELKTPLTSIRGALGLVASGKLGESPAEAQRMIDLALSNTERLVRLVQDILDIERMNSEQEDLTLQVTDARSLISQAVDLMTPAADEASVNLSSNAAPTPLWVDPDRILQLMSNLLSNAIKFSEPGGQVRISTLVDGDELLVQVADCGRGIPADMLDRIFGRFQQVDASDSRSKGGTGLGLAICRTIAELHGGKIWAESELGAGSTFSFTLPMLGRPAHARGSAPTVGRERASSDGNALA